mmetsp:Transcript_21035/g.24351  ORF Transcript_21035/g.24351 Transcript_21035/m.24351 type:complete len:90 (+) Transcript_21035:347-616(+)
MKDRPMSFIEIISLGDLGYELRCHRWIQVPITDVEKWYADNIGEKYIHQSTKIYGGNLSVRFPTGMKPLFILGQDEVIFKQFSFNRIRR